MVKVAVLGGMMLEFAEISPETCECVCFLLVGQLDGRIPAN